MAVGLIIDMSLAVNGGKIRLTDYTSDFSFFSELYKPTCNAHELFFF